MLLALLCGGVSGALAADRIYAEAAELSPGSTSEISIILENEAAYYGFQADITLSGGLEFANVDGRHLNVTLTDRLGDSYTAVSNLINPGVVRLGTFSTSHTPISGNKGAVMTFEVKAPEDYTGGEIRLSDIISVGEGDREIRFNGSISSLGGSAADRLCIGNISLVYNKPETVALQLTNTRDCAGFSTDIYLPAGVSVDEASIVSSSRGNAVSHSMMPDGALRITSSGSGITGNSGDVVYFEITALPDAAEDLEIRLCNQLMTTADGMEIYLIPEVSKFSVAKAPVEEIQLNASELSLYFGKTSRLSATVLPEYAFDKNLSWTSENPEVAAVSEDGTVAATGIGITDIVATATDGSGLSVRCRVEVKPLHVSAITLSATSLTLKRTETATLTATLTPSEGIDPSVVWAVENPEIAGVSDTGVVTALKEGRTTLTVTSVSDPEVSAVCEIHVADTPVEKIALNHSSAKIRTNGTLQLEATVYPETATNKTIFWSSSDENIATVDANGLVTPINVGTVSILAMSTDGSEVKGVCSLEVLPVDVEGISLSTYAVSLKVEENVTIEAEVTPVDATDRSLIWTVADTDIATVTDSGTVTALKEGTTTLTVTSVSNPDIKAICEITVAATPVAEISLNRTSCEIPIDGSLQLEATVSPVTATDKTLVWESSDENVATVDDSGLVTACGLGAAVITVTAADGSGVSASCMVTVTRAAITTITLDTDHVALRIGGTAAVTATVEPADAADPTLLWSIADSDIASVTDDGVITALNIGNTVLTVAAASNPDIFATCGISVTGIPVESVVFEEEFYILSPDEELVLNVNVAPADASERGLKWSSSNPEVATVDESGKVTAIAAGATTVTAEAIDGNGAIGKTDIIVVDDQPQESVVTYDFSKPEALTPVQSVNTGNSPVCEVNNVVFTNKDLSLTASGGGTLPRLWYNASKGVQLRVYNGGSLTISSQDPTVVITSVEFAGNQLEALKADGAAFTNSTNVVYQPATSANSVKFDCVSNGSSKRADISTIKVCYRKQSVIEVYSVKIVNKPKEPIQPGESYKLEAIVLPESASDKNLEWRSDDPAVASVSQDGTVMGVGPGETIISVRSASKPELSDSCTISCKVFTGIAEESEEKISVSVDGTTIIISGPNARFAELYTISGIRLGLTVESDTQAIFNGNVNEIYLVRTASSFFKIKL